MKNGEVVNIDNPLEYPDPMRVEYAEEPFIQANIITPSQFVGPPLITLCMEKRGVQVGMNYLDEKRVELMYEMPLSEVLFEFYDRMKSVSRGYASFDYQLIGYKRTDLVRLDILVNGEPVDALSQLVFRGVAANCVESRFVRGCGGRDSPPSAVQDCNPGSYRWYHCKQRDHHRIPQGCHS